MPNAIIAESAQPKAPQTGLKLAVMALGIAVLGLPLNSVAAYAVLVAAAVVVFTGFVRIGMRAWGGAAAIVVVAIGLQALTAPPRIDEGFNVFLPGGVLERDLPADVYRALADEFERQYPADKRCDPKEAGCWVSGGRPDRVYAFAADGIFHKSDLSRAVTSIDFSNPVWHRLGFTNEQWLNWYPVSDVQRARRNGQFWKSYDRWQLTMPWFEVVRLPAAYVGGELCWRGDILWEGPGGRFSAQNNGGCRGITAEDAGRKVFGLAIKPDTLAMTLKGPADVQVRQWAQPLIKLIAVIGIVVVLVRIEPRRAVVPALLLAFAALSIAMDDASFLGGMRPHDGGDDGLFYDGLSRIMLQKLLAGDWRGFLEGGESVFYYGGPGIRYFRTFEHILFGDSYLGYLTLVLLLPLIVLMLFRRFLDAPWPLVLALLFVTIPIGVVFGTTFTDYSKWAARGFADPMAYILVMAGLVVLVGQRETGPRDGFWSAFFAALLIVLGVAMKPLVVVAAFVLLAGAWLWAVLSKQWRRVIGLSIGALPILSMALHNWVFGGKFVLFSDNAGHPLVLVMPPSAWIAAAQELVGLDFSGGVVRRGLAQISGWLAGNAQKDWVIPANVIAIAMLVHVTARGRSFDPWLRLIAVATLAQHAVVLFYVSTPRYHFLTWFLTLLVAARFVQQTGLPWLAQRYPALMARLTALLWPPRMAAALSWLDRGR